MKVLTKSPKRELAAHLRERHGRQLELSYVTVEELEHVHEVLDSTCTWHLVKPNVYERVLRDSEETLCCARRIDALPGHHLATDSANLATCQKAALNA